MLHAKSRSSQTSGSPRDSDLLFLSFHSILTRPPPPNLDQDRRLKAHTSGSCRPRGESRPRCSLAVTLDHSPTNPQASATSRSAAQPRRGFRAEPGTAAASGGLSLGEWGPAGTLRRECGRRGRRRACRSDSSAPRRAWEAGSAGRTRGLSHPPGRACPPAGFLQSRAREEGRR